MAELLTHLRKLVLVHEDMCLEMERVAARAKDEDSSFQAELKGLCDQTERIATELKRIADQVVSEETFELSMDDVEDVTDSWKPPFISQSSGETMPSPFEALESSASVEDAKARSVPNEGIDALLKGYLSDDRETVPKRTGVLYEGTAKLQQYACRNLQEVKLAGVLANKARSLDEVLDECQMDEVVLKAMLARFIQNGLARKRVI